MLFNTLPSAENTTWALQTQTLRLQFYHHDHLKASPTYTLTRWRDAPSTSTKQHLINCQTTLGHTWTTQGSTQRQFSDNFRTDWVKNGQQSGPKISLGCLPKKSSCWGVTVRSRGMGWKSSLFLRLKMVSSSLCTFNNRHIAQHLMTALTDELAISCQWI